MLCGWAGRKAAQIVEAAFSRSREHLADAFAVQFTRNTRSLTGALRKIGGIDPGARFQNSQALTMKSFFISKPGGSGRRTGLFSSHPSLASRILALDPDWDGIYTPVSIQDGAIPAGSGEQNNAQANDYSLKLPLLTLAAPLLKSLDQPSRISLTKMVQAMIVADNRLDVFESAAALILEKYLGPILAKSGGAGQKRTVLAVTEMDVLTILSSLAHLGASAPEAASRKIRETLILAVLDCALHDREINRREYEIICALAAALDIALPLAPRKSA